MRISILGGCGFIGSHLTETFLADGHVVTIFDHLNADRKNINHIENAIRFVGGDFHNTGEVSQAISGSEMVVHLISSTVPGSSLKNPSYDAATNVVSSINLFEECVHAKIRKVIFISSGGTVYGIPQYLPIAETHPLNPICHYGISKMAIEKYLSLYHYQYGLDFTVLRLSNPYGVRQNPNTGQGVVASWMSSIKKREPIEIWGDGGVVRDYVYIKDAVEAIKKAALSSTEQKIFNVGSGKGYSLTQLHEMMEECVGKNVPIISKSSRKVDVPINILDISLIRNELFWDAETSLEDGLKMMWQGFADYEM